MHVRNRTLIPELGKLYQARSDNLDYLKLKYNYYYVGLILCIELDVQDDLIMVPSSIDDQVVNSRNPLYSFQPCNLNQHFSQVDFFDRQFIKIGTNLFLTFREFNDMFEHTHE